MWPAFFLKLENRGTNLHLVIVAQAASQYRPAIDKSASRRLEVFDLVATTHCVDRGVPWPDSRVLKEVNFALRRTTDTGRVSVMMNCFPAINPATTRTQPVFVAFSIKPVPMPVMAPIATIATKRLTTPLLVRRLQSGQTKDHPKDRQ